MVKLRTMKIIPPVHGLLEKITCIYKQPDNQSIVTQLAEPYQCACRLSSVFHQPTVRAPALLKAITSAVLLSVNTIKLSQLLKTRECYELKLWSNATEMRSLKTVALASGIDRSLLKSLIYARKLDQLAPNKATDTILDLEPDKYIHQLVSRNGPEYDLNIGNWLRVAEVPSSVLLLHGQAQTTHVFLSY